MKKIALVFAAVSASALAEPTVVRFDPFAPYDPFTDILDLRDFHPSAPDVQLSLYPHDTGGGSNATVWYPAIINSEWHPFMKNELEVQSAVAGGAYLGPGVEVPSSAVGPWGVGLYDTDDFPFGRIARDVFPFKDDCLSCTYTVLFLSIDEGNHYIAIRWEENDETYHGWVTFSVEHLPYPQHCIHDDGLGSCDNYDLESLRQLRLRYVAVGWENEPDTPITTGGGLCRADMNFDTQFDFFDVTAYLSAYIAQDPRADYTDDGSFDFFDVAAFIGEYNAGCAF